MSKELRILVAEDNTDDVFLLEQAFKRAGVQTQLHAVGDGVETMAYLNGEGSYAERSRYPFPNLMLLDLNMPRMNGFEVLERIRNDAHFGSLVVHVLTTSTRDADVRRAYRLGANSYVVKPTRVEEMVAFAGALHQWHSFTTLPSTADDSAN